MIDMLIDSETASPVGSTNPRIPNDMLIGDRADWPKPKELPSWLSKLEAQLVAIQSLPENWDSYGAAAPDREIVGSAYGFLEFVAENVEIQAPQVTPTPSGGVLLDWHVDDHEIEVELVSAHAASYVYENMKTGEMTPGSLFNDCADDGRFLQILREHFAN